MAAALIPLIASLAPELINLITGLVHKAAPTAEVTNGPSTGPVKFAEVFSFVMDSLNKAAVAGQIPKSLPSDDVIKAIIQAVVTSMKLGGLLDGSSLPTVTPAAQAIALKAGQSLTITVQP